jgi:hypothetical protein
MQSKRIKKAKKTVKFTGCDLRKGLGGGYSPESVGLQLEKLFQFSQGEMLLNILFLHTVPVLFNF